MYKLYKDMFGESITGVNRLSDNAFIPFAYANTDYQKFKHDVLSGAELQNADGNTMTQDEANAFIATLP